jgi:hypothetical protein
MKLQVEGQFLVIRHDNGLLKWYVHLHDIEAEDAPPTIELTFPEIVLTQKSGLGEKTLVIK